MNPLLRSCLSANKKNPKCLGVRSPLELPGSPPYLPQAARAGESSARGALGAGGWCTGRDLGLQLSQPPAMEQSGDPGEGRESGLCGAGS